MFANGDYGQYVREEMNGPRKEFVMADLKGPGAVVRIWSANPSGTIRMYFDGESIPRIEASMKDLLRGKVAPWGNEFAYEASRGCNLYFPFPYAKSLKVTVDESEGAGKARGVYYHVNYRTYETGTAVETFSPSENWKELTPYFGARGVNAGWDHLHKEFRLNPSTNHEIEFTQSNRAISAFTVLVVPPMSHKKPDLPKLMRQIIVEISFDGEKCVEMPLGDFFATAPGINSYESYPVKVSGRELSTRFRMPFAKGATFRFRNVGSVPVSLSTQYELRPYEWDERSMHFHAQWTAYYGHTRPFRDMHLLDVKGQGYYVGTFLNVANPTPAWWGEGDEKVYVDGESFPSTFGTGTEDYFGYAWSSNELFQRPYHAQSFAEKPASFGNSAVVRWHFFDPIPFTSSLKFDLELWHWEDVMAGYYRGAFWYARPGGTPPIAVNEALLVAPTIEHPKPVEGAIEGETLKVLKKSGGKVEIQEGFWEISGGKQLWWTFPDTNDSLELSVPVVSTGTYEIIGNLCTAHDYGKHRIDLGDGKPVDIDFFSPGLKWKQFRLGTVKLNKGNARLKVTCLGHNDKAVAGNMFGLDYLILKRIK